MSLILDGATALDLPLYSYILCNSCKFYKFWITYNKLLKVHSLVWDYFLQLKAF